MKSIKGEVGWRLGGTEELGASAKAEAKDGRMDGEMDAHCTRARAHATALRGPRGGNLGNVRLQSVHWEHEAEGCPGSKTSGTPA